VLVPG